MTWTVRTPSGNTRGPLYAELALAALHQAASKGPFFLSVERRGNIVDLRCDASQTLREALTAQLYAHYPDCRLEEGGPREEAGSEARWWWASVSLVPDVWPLRKRGDYRDGAAHASADPLAGVLHALGNAEEGIAECSVSLELCAAPKAAGGKALRDAERFGDRPRHLAWARSPSRLRRLIARLLGFLGSRPARDARDRRNAARETARAKLGGPLFAVRIRIGVRADRAMDARARRTIRDLASALATLPEEGAGTFVLGAIRVAHSVPARGRGSASLLSPADVSVLWHPPTEAVRHEALPETVAKEPEPPQDLPAPGKTNGTVPLGSALYRGTLRACGLPQEDRFRHLMILGRTGSGKSTLLKRMARADLRGGRGFALLDPHGDLARSLLEAVPRHRTADTVFFDLADADFALSFNPLSGCVSRQRPLVASALLGAFKKLYGNSWGPRLEHVLRNALLAELEQPDASFVTLQRLLSDAAFRARRVRRLSDPVVRAFWQREFAAMPARLQAEALSPVQNKVGQFVSFPLLRRVFGQPRGRLDVRSIMDSGGVLIVDLAAGRAGEDAAWALGAFLLASIQVAALARAEQPEQDRRPFYLYADEFQHVLTDGLAGILSQARKYRLGLTLATQHLAQIDEATRAAILGNVGSLVAFQVGADDAEVVRAQLGGGISADDLMALPRGRAYARLLVGGEPRRPFLLATDPPAPSPAQVSARGRAVERSTRQRYARPAEEVDAGIAAAFGLP